MNRRFLFDASSIIVLAETGYLALFCDLLPSFTTTSIIITEVTQKLTPIKKIVEELITKEKIFVQLVDDSSSPSSNSLYYKLGLHEGEISLLLISNQETDIIVIDDLIARSVAQAEGLLYTGLLGLVISLKKIGKLSQEKALDILEAITRTNFRMSVTLYNAIREELEK
ncbi:MAG: DUF3368 domain-containing protein [Candidatus Heimdallarchaeota archaeon]|nr:DUF3368 domain-containing protein [Candidatus Heimdallarchaeota archaeon]